MKLKIAISALILALAGSAYAYHAHGWVKMNSFYAVDQFGNQVEVCTWVCRADWNNQHTTQTQGQVMCPYPF